MVNHINLILISNVLINRRKHHTWTEATEFRCDERTDFHQDAPEGCERESERVQTYLWTGFTDKNQNLGQKQIVNLKTGYNGFIRNQTLFIKPEDIDQKVKLPHLIRR